jgi:uncharacterized metal-binding protein
MPSGKNHDRITWITLPVIVLGTLIISQSFILSLLVAFSFLFSGLMFGPDLDIYSVQYNRWGWFKFIWLPYQKNLKHRSLFSHGFLIGTIIRMLYLSVLLFVPLILLVTIAQIILDYDWYWQKILGSFYVNLTNKYALEAIAIFIGLELGAMSHYLADDIGSRMKRANKKKNQLKIARRKGKKSRQ